MGEPGRRPRSRVLKVEGRGVKGGLERMGVRVVGGMGVFAGVWVRVRRWSVSGDMMFFFEGVGVFGCLLSKRWVRVNLGRGVRAVGLGWVL